MHVAAVDLAPPAIADSDFAVAGGGAVADHEMVGEAVAHPADVAVVVIEDAGVALPSAAVVDDDKRHRSRPSPNSLLRLLYAGSSPRCRAPLPPPR